MFPGNFVNVNSPRGVIFSTNGNGLRVANNGFVDVNAGFSVGSTVVNVKFVVAASNTLALVTGFGSVFADVGRSDKTIIPFYDVSDTRSSSSPRGAGQRHGDRLGAGEGQARPGRDG